MRESSKITIELSRDEAIVLFEWLARFNAQGGHAFEDQAEQRALWNLECLFESTLSEPLSESYATILAAARAKLRDVDE
jgi:hypothetical protein